MSAEAKNGAGRDDASSSQRSQKPAPRQGNSIFTIPKPLKQVFDKFPMVVYAANELPQRSRRSNAAHTLYVFIDAADANFGRPSYNPGCLKWQAYLKFTGVPFALKPSNNHASPSGALPFLLPARNSSSARAAQPVASAKLEKWISEQTNKPEDAAHMRYDAYMALIEHRIRNAYLYTLYLDPKHDDLLQSLYTKSTTRTPLLRSILATQLKKAAHDHLLNNPSQSPTAPVNPDELFADSAAAFEALSTLLGEEQQYFFGRSTPGLFDAAVFAYTHILLDDEFGWAEDTKIVKQVRRCRNLVRHRNTLLEGFFT